MTTNKVAACWKEAGEVHVVVKEDTHFGEGLRVLDLSTMELDESLYHNMDELVEGRGLDRDEVYYHVDITIKGYRDHGPPD